MNDEKSKKLIELIKDDYSNMAGIIISKNNKIIFENYFNGFDKKDPIHIASATKSITSILVGIAIDQGLIKSVDQKVLDFFPEYKIKRGEKQIQKITIKNLLTMTAPYKCKSEPYAKVYSSDDWTKSTLDLLGGKGKIGDFRYLTAGMQILSGILVSATGQTMFNFAKKNLFGPLGIKMPSNFRMKTREDFLAFVKGEHVNGWIVDSKGVNTSGWGLTLTTQDILKIGQLYLKKGKWNGKQIVSQKWVKESTEEHSRWGELPYGYLWWRINKDKDNCFAAIGDGGNIIYVNPKKRIVIAITSKFMPRAKDRIELINNSILPLLG